MQLRQILDNPCGIRYMFDSLQLMSSCGRNVLLDSQMMTDPGQIRKSYARLREVYDALYVASDGVSSAVLASLKHRLMCLREIHGTLSRLESGVVLDDIDLFEVKYLALLNAAVKSEADAIGIDTQELPDLEEVVRILDPDGMRIESFYVYDSYSKELAHVRAELKKTEGVKEETISVKNKEDETLAENGTEGRSRDRMLELLNKEKLIEREIREELSGKIRKYLAELRAAMLGMGEIDVLLAKALQIKMLHLCFPVISDNEVTQYEGMFHPYIVYLFEQQKAKDFVTGRGKRFIPIDIEFALESVSIIGANMGGKTVVLKMAALNQLLFQFGFGVAAAKAVVDVKENVVTCIGDNQNEVEGLSSFAGEIKGINTVLECIKRGEKILAVIDEPARTTNPIEGTVLVEALLNVLKGKKSSVIITTHYNVAGEFFRRLRVNGLADGKMDYRLRQTSSADVPHEAIDVARSLGMDAEWIDCAQRLLSKR